MASKVSAAILLLSLNLLFFSVANANIVKHTECPKNNVNVCVNVLKPGGILAKDSPCCTHIQHLVALKAERCLCAIVKANNLGLVEADPTVQLELLLNGCGCRPTRTYYC
ncbi:hypothetical protein ERO13_A12G219825v2 [Gossypium hirsutum]|uniref:Hydrophobic seed protein domain-containing protein n=5 Tax=Gossypium TaxID=3633 RepID=A0A2P5X7K7_GOSBA|nr:putative lipid-binding protein AIR1 [Gossypium hirsutum]KAB2054073.1 hypothetical protein ES319_A12G229700v1 [Gossypium barbadense]TXG74528.1 hypothetical protein ES288_1Z036500v1 [Gossypium darwinii]TYH97564.1 hypothetical protein ES332_A12G251300v1 [Gossypium tomentosum]TYJ06482.1 hypothetical protein E1A91_A12G236700v1 [Gossypium mustelinum]KAG4171596.1 hypothetical protein ERO13_A12G219825v2 [Gossypium hirsutum]